MILTFESQIFLNFHTIVIYCHQKTHLFCKPKFTLRQNVIFVAAFGISCIEENVYVIYKKW